MSSITRAARRGTAVAAVTCGAAALAALLAACGRGASPSADSSPSTTRPGSSSPAPSSPPGTTPASPSTAPSSGQCAPTGLTATVDASQGGAAAGSSYVPIDFKNISAHTCVMYGFPGVSWVTGVGGSQIGSAASRETSYASVTVTLAPGGSAHAVMQIADAGNFSPSACQPVTAHWLRVYPPDQYTSLYAAFTTTVCSKKITSGGFPLGIMPVRPGDGVRGEAP
jgi:hypothetical protein